MTKELHLWNSPVVILHVDNQAHERKRDIMLSYGGKLVTHHFYSLSYLSQSKGFSKGLRKWSELQSWTTLHHALWAFVSLIPHPTNLVARRHSCEWASKNEKVLEGYQLHNGSQSDKSDSGIGPNLILPCWWIKKMLQSHWSLFLWLGAEWAISLILSALTFWIKEEKWRKRN